MKVIMFSNRNSRISTFMHDGYFQWMIGNFWCFKFNNTFNLRKTQELLLPRSEKRIWKQISRQSWPVQSHLESFKSKLSQSNNPRREKIYKAALKNPLFCQKSWLCFVLVSKKLHHPLHGQMQSEWNWKNQEQIYHSVKACNLRDHYQIPPFRPKYTW